MMYGHFMWKNVFSAAWAYLADSGSGLSGCVDMIIADNSVVSVTGANFDLRRFAYLNVSNPA